MAGPVKFIVLCIFVFASPLLAGEAPFSPVSGGMDCTVEELSGTENARFHVQGVSWDGQWLSYTEEYGQDDDGKPIRTIFLLNLETGEKSEFNDICGQPHETDICDRHLWTATDFFS